MIAFMVIRIFSFCFALILFLLQWKKKVILINLKLCNIPSDSFNLFSFYTNLSTDLLSFIFLSPSDTYHIRKNDIQKFSLLKKSGGLLLTAHFHNWELMGTWLCLQGLPLKGSAKKLKNSFWNFILTFVRHKKNKLPSILNFQYSNGLHWLNQGNVFGVLLDQHFPSSQTLSTFFQHKVHTLPLPFLLHSKTQLNGFLFFLTPKNQIRIIQITHSGCSINKQTFYARYHKILEILIKTYPEYWYGFCHRRFKNIVPNPYDLI